MGTKCAVHNNDLDRFVSLDDKSVRIWQAPTLKKRAKDINQINFPKNQTNFVQTIIYIPKLKVYVASALDMTLKIYDGKYTELTSVRTGQRAILCLAYNNARDELVTGEYRAVFTKTSVMYVGMRRWRRRRFFVVVRICEKSAERE